MNKIRRASPDDLEALYRISVQTGHLGDDASRLYIDYRMMGHIYSAPYLKYSPQLAYVIEHHNQVVGYCVGTNNTVEFEAVLESQWWPSLRQRYSKPDEGMRSTWTADERRCQMIHVPEKTPEQISICFPAHLHMNLLPVIQGQGMGALLLDTWMRCAKRHGVAAVHVGANAKNAKAIRFWQKHGFSEIDALASRTAWMGRFVSCS
ncbi:GNAT family N-acetyltransferase [Pseudovibrio sp. Tun.PSC04-5.I4]|uniref:GNAT family N-acetyltransferase n=1 Tax=Pseudovibrio sp. Tun.PSC04-5.I4 TaxID=1798213 RepID=UPI00087EF7D6|nr:GNAT family N-acetyltransferase [Pseudovibrio sp. Tun.PSC04-5.I4]SDR49247.1 Acetyltransferase (GNAT) family protein [Pseudovibrio sp. Tun.PSC04-5.I4]